MRRFTTGIGSLLLLVVLLAGIPAGLILVSGNPIPSLDELSRALSMPDYGGAFLIGTLLPIVAWVAWLTFAVGFLVEIPAQIRGIEAPSIPLLSFQQKSAAVLIAAILVMFAGVGTLGQASPASAAELTPQAGISQSFSLASSNETVNVVDEESAVTAESASTEATASAPTYTVQDGDSLWRIAEKYLGSGERFNEIAQMNYGVEQGDGFALTPANWLNAGWVLTLPADAETGATSAAANDTVMAADQVTVESGDTLWGIAEDTLGDGARYPEIFEATKATPQPNGQLITDPNLIYPGQQVTVPGPIEVEATATAPTPEPAATITPLAAPSVDTETTTPAPISPSAAEPTETAGANSGTQITDQTTTSTEEVDAAPSSNNTSDLSGIGIETSTPQPASETAAEQSTPTVSAADIAESENWTDDAFIVPLSTAGGIGGLLAAGLLALLGIRRSKQRRRRLPGQRINMPTEDLSAMELELRTVENPMGMDDVDHVLRHLAVWSQDTGIALPPVYAIRLAPNEISIYLDATTDLPQPFVAVTEDKQAWVIDPADLPELDRIPSAPYPALVTLGHDATDAQILVDLEHIGALNLTGSPEATSGVSTALAVELATSHWAEDLQITLVDVAEGLPSALDTGRVRHVDNIQTLLRNLRGQAAATEKALAELGVDSIEHARSIDTEAEAWIPEIVILGKLPDQAVQDELAELVTRLPRVGIASITNGHLTGEWSLEIGDDRTAVLQPLGLPIRPQTVSAEEYSKILELLNVTETASVDGPEWSVHLEREELRLEEIATPAANAESVAVPSAEQLPDSGNDEEDDWKDALRRLLPIGDVNAVAPAAENIRIESESADQEAASNSTDLSADTADALLEDTFEGNPIVQLRQAPYVRLLGTVSLHDARGEEPRNVYTSEINRSVVNRATELITFLALNPGPRSAVEVHAALWPGNDPTGDQASKSRNGLVTRARKWLGNSDSGEPYFPPVGAIGYRLHSDIRSDWDVWLKLIGDDVTQTSTASIASALRLVDGQPISGVKDKNYIWAERIRQEMIASIGDAAHELATRSLRTGDINHARLAAAIGRQVDPINELFWRDALRAEHQAGDPKGFDRIVAQLESHLESFEDGYEAEPETTQLIHQIREHAIAS